jgi:ABC-type transport system involved in multi-copper enzyme maturation permease subunit
MSSIVDIAANTLRIIIRNKVLYLVVFLLILIMAFAIMPIAIIRMAAESDQQELARQMQVTLVVGLFGLWIAVTQAIAIFLGATAVSSEVRARTIVTLLSKPVERWRFLFGKWLGNQVALLLFFGVGVAISTAMFLGFDMWPSGLFWIGVARSFLVVMILGGLALLFSTFTSAVFAGGATVLLGILTGLIARAVDAPFVWARWPARGYYFLAPASPPGNLLQQGFAADLLDPEYALYAGVLFENLWYALALIVLACVVFTRREVQVR